jgi:hypothetical protein
MRPGILVIRPTISTTSLACITPRHLHLSIYTKIHTTSIIHLKSAEADPYSRLPITIGSVTDAAEDGNELRDSELPTPSVPTELWLYTIDHVLTKSCGASWGSVRKMIPGLLHTTTKATTRHPRNCRCLGTATEACQSVPTPL